MATAAMSRHTGEFPGLSSARINVIGGGEPAVLSVSHPLQAEAMRTQQVAPFTGRCEDWERFEADWNMYLRVMQSGGVNALPDTQVLWALKGRLDRGSETMLMAEFRKNPGLTYYEFWGKLKGRFARDVRGCLSPKLAKRHLAKTRLPPNSK